MAEQETDDLVQENEETLVPPPPVVLKFPDDVFRRIAALLKAKDPALRVGDLLIHDTTGHVYKIVGFTQSGYVRMVDPQSMDPNMECISSNIHAYRRLTQDEVQRYIHNIVQNLVVQLHSLLTNGRMEIGGAFQVSVTKICDTPPTFQILQAGEILSQCDLPFVEQLLQQVISGRSVNPNEILFIHPSSP